MYCDTFWLLKSVVTDANTILMQSLQVCILAENASVGVSQWAAETYGICQDKVGLTTQRKDKKVSEYIRKISQSMSISDSLAASP